MLRRHSVTAAAVLVLAALVSLPALAQVDGETETPGNNCPTGATPGQAASANWDTFFECNASGKWQRGPYFFGATSDTCDSNHAGMVQYTSGTLEACNGTSWTPIDSGMHFISTKTASNSASLQFTNLPTTYNTLFLNCTGLLLTHTFTGLLVYVGEGAGPTWETTAYYVEINNWQTTNSSGGAGPGIAGGETVSDITGGQLDGASGSTATIPQSFKAYIDNVGSSNLVKVVTWNAFQYDPETTPPDITGFSGWSFWSKDTNPITGIEIVGDSDTITSGTCSLYGMN